MTLPRERAFDAIAALLVVVALAVILVSVLRRDVAPPPRGDEPVAVEPGGRVDPSAGRSARVAQGAGEPPVDLAPGHAPWVPAELPDQDVAAGATAEVSGATALKKCCDALRAGSRRAMALASSACDRVFATLSSRSGPASDTLATAALVAVRETIERQPKAPSVPAACR